MELALVLCFGAFAGSIITWAWWVINPKLGKRERDVEKQKEQLHQQLQTLDQQQKHFHHELQSQLDKERTRISSELHDDIIQRLSGIRLSLLHITSIHTITNETSLLIKQLAADLTETMEITRVLIWDLSMPEVEGRLLSVILRELCSKISRSSLLKINFLSVMDEWERQLSDQVKKEVYHIVQEAVQNAIKYSNGWKIDLKLQWHHNRVSISIEDDGEGIKTKTSNGFGVENLHRRAYDINASLKYLTKEPHGTVVLLEIPYE